MAVTNFLFVTLIDSYESFAKRNQMKIEFKKLNGQTLDSYWGLRMKFMDSILLFTQDT